MSKKILAVLAILAAALPAARAAETRIELGEGSAVARPLEAAVTAPASLPVGRLGVFSGEKSFVPAGADGSFLWKFPDGITARGREVSHAFETPGPQTVRLEIRAGAESATAESEIFIFKGSRVVVAADPAAPGETLGALAEDAARAGILLTIVPEDGLRAGQLTLQNAADIGIWGGADELGRLLDFAQKNEVNFFGKRLILFTDEDFAGLRPLGFLTLSVLGPDAVIFARPGDGFSWLELAPEQFLPTLTRRGREVTAMDRADLAPRIWNFAGGGVNRLLSSGVPRGALGLVLLLPFLAVLVVFLKQVIGMKTGGVAFPLLLTVAIVPLGLGLGIAAAGVVFVGTIAGGWLAARLGRMMAVPGLAFRVIVPAILGLAILVGGSYAGLVPPAEAMPSLLVLFLLSEKFSDLHREKSWLSTLGNAAQILVVVLLGWGIATRLPSFENLLLLHPELTLLAIFANWLLARYTGLRLTEQWRYRELSRMREGEEE